MDWILCPWGGEICDICKIVDGNHRDIMGIYHFPQIIIMGNTLVRMYTNTERGLGMWFKIIQHKTSQNGVCKNGEFLLLYSAFLVGLVGHPSLSGESSIIKQFMFYLLFIGSCSVSWTQETLRNSKCNTLSGLIGELKVIFITRNSKESGKSQSCVFKG